MTSYAWAISIHVVTAILGLGQVAGVLVVASSMAEAADSASWVALRRLVLGTRWSLIVILLSGVFIEYSFGGPFHRTWWFRLSFLGLVALGALSGFMGRALRQRASAGNERTRATVMRVAASMCVITATIAVLMELKPG